MLEDQEATARRFSHELHDELGQSLTAVKTNLTALADGGAAPRRGWHDCLSWWTKPSATCARCRSCCGPPSSTISAWRPACAGWRRASRRAPGIEVKVRLHLLRPAARRDRDAPVPHRAGGADQRRAPRRGEARDDPAGERERARSASRSQDDGRGSERGAAAGGARPRT